MASAVFVAYCMLFPGSAYAPPVLILSQGVQILPALLRFVPGLISALSLITPGIRTGTLSGRLTRAAIAVAVFGVAANAWMWSSWSVQSEQDKHRNMVRIYDYQARWSLAGGPEMSLSDQVGASSGLMPLEVFKLAGDRGRFLSVSP